MSNLQHAYNLSRLPAEQETVLLPHLNFDGLLAIKDELAKNNILVARSITCQTYYRAFQRNLEAASLTVQQHTSDKIRKLTKNFMPRAILLADDYPANILPSESGAKATHYNLWLGKWLGSVDFIAGEAVLSGFHKWDSDRTAYCFKRPFSQSVPAIDGFPYDHCHVFTEATIPPTPTGHMAGIAIFYS